MSAGTAWLLGFFLGNLWAFLLGYFVVYRFQEKSIDYWYQNSGEWMDRAFKWRNGDFS